MPDLQAIKHLCDEVRQTAYDIHVFLGQGHFGKVYENALVHRLRKAGLSVEQQYSMKVYDEDGTELGAFAADLFVNSKLLVELKACKTMAPEHTAQLLGYMRAARIDHGLLINFGSYRFEIKKYITGNHDRTQRAVTKQKKELPQDS